MRLRAQAAWELSVALMSSQHAPVRFFAANTIHQKLRAGGADLPEEAQASLPLPAFHLPDDHSPFHALPTESASALRAQSAHSARSAWHHDIIAL